MQQVQGGGLPVDFYESEKDEDGGQECQLEGYKDPYENEDDFSEHDDDERWLQVKEEAKRMEKGEAKQAIGLKSS